MEKVIQFFEEPKISIKLLTLIVAFRVTNKHFQSFLHFKGTKDAKTTRGRPEIDRIQLRQLLLDSLPKDLIHWSHHLKSIEEKDGHYHIHFRDQPPQTGFDLIIGGDGC